MTDLLIFALFGYGLIRFFRFFGLLIAIGLIVLWFTQIKNTVGLFYEKKKIRATLFLFVPGVILLFLGIYFRFIWTPSFSDYDGYDSYSSGDYVPPTPTLATLYIANYSDEMGYLQVGTFRDSLDSKKEREISIPSEKDQDTLRLWLGDSLVLDTIITGGNWVGNFSDDISVSAEEVVYSAYTTTSTEDLEYVLLAKPGIEMFTSSTYADIYGFSSKAPSTVSVSSGTSRITKWDVEVMTDEDLMKLLIDAIGEDEGDLEDESEE